MNFKQADFLTLTLTMNDDKDIVDMISNGYKNLPKIFIISGSPWNHLLPYIQKIESHGFQVTNTALQAIETEMKQADSVVYLRGWGGTMIGRKMNELRKQLNKRVTERKFVYVSDSHALPALYENDNDTPEITKYRKDMKIPMKANPRSPIIPIDNPKKYQTRGVYEYK
ncbi:MAG: hypothetical protein WC319_10975 [Candidatus Paceibacterota bacterium]|jgi:hypothetical protein